ncbi:MAG TPA: 3-phosphoshikimate 1-carboxyvinyltransferase [Solirubrobacterales bacterium]
MTRFAPAARLRGELRPPPDKSISHRAAILAAMGEGETRVEGYLDSADTRSTLAAVAAVGAEVAIAAGEAGLEARIGGVGLRGPRPAEIDVGNAGTLLRILPGWLAGQGAGEWVLDGDDSIRRRPVDRIAVPLRAMGAAVECREARLPPLRVTGSALTGTEHRLAVASAQVKSCLLLAGLLAEGETTVIEPSPSRDHSERMLAAAGARLHRADTAVTIEPASELRLGEVAVPGDFSSAAFWIVAATLAGDSEVRLRGVNLNETRTGLLPILERMGAAVEAEPGGTSGGEPAGDVVARHGPLRSTLVRGEEVPRAIDELPLVGLAACFAEGDTRVVDAAELRHKESDRIAATVGVLNALGGDAEELEDGFVVRGTGGLRGGAIDSGGDHRVAMLGAIAGLASREGAEVRGMEAAAVSYPGFERDLAGLL